MQLDRSALDQIRREARALVDAVTDDDSGAMVAGQWTGGHGGLLSRATISKADALRRSLAALDQAEAAAHG